MASTACGPMRPLLAQPNKVKRGQMGQPTSPQGQVGPKPQLGPPQLFLTPNPIKPKMAIKTLRTHFGQGPPWTTFQPMASGSHQRPPDKPSSILPLNLRGIIPIPPCTPYPRLEEQCIYGIIYHYAPFFLRNSMMTLSEPNYMIPNQVPKSNAHFEGVLFSSSVWHSMVGIRGLFKDPNHLALQEFGWRFN
ncbi:hypothetical protein O181_042481 [Austropuccinia psidii MF-1]|uniref:Uncharacterized protein n=1 Tax=Austropuccinia psidii MF-1 TaxID=1389203 RepID=A0A9Q3HF63_9BASI|nr:hypothetical protein [Austropuccinia psidii MF-1]